MIIQAGDLNVILDTGTNEPGQILQRLEPDGWWDYPFDGPVSYLMDLSQLPAGKRNRDGNRKVSTQCAQTPDW